LTENEKGGGVSLFPFTLQGTGQVPERLTALGKIPRLAQAGIFPAPHEARFSPVGA
jgi:hypothetical protein